MIEEEHKKSPVGRPKKEIAIYDLHSISVTSEPTKANLESEAITVLRKVLNLTPDENNIKLIINAAQEILKHSRAMEFPEVVEVVESPPEEDSMEGHMTSTPSIEDIGRW